MQETHLRVAEDNNGEIFEYGRSRQFLPLKESEIKVRILHQKLSTQIGQQQRLRIMNHDRCEKVRETTNDAALMTLMQVKHFVAEKPMSTMH